MNIYNDYMELIKATVNSNDSDGLAKGMSGLGTPSVENRVHFQSLVSKIKDNKVAPSMMGLSESLRRKVDYEQQLGNHPQFSHLKGTEEIENHYAVSAFIDIKGSTNLFKRFSNKKVWLITNTILKAGIHTMLIFGGYIHRLQGDGIFVYFGDKDTTQEDAVKMALSAVSVFTHFVKTDLKEYLESVGVEYIGIRTGIDFGYNEDVIWGNSGIGEISEVTTCSLHTSLASKMQSSAEKNGVVVGQNVKDQLHRSDEFFTPVSSRLSENDRYIFRDDSKQFYYTQYDFNWFKFLKTLDFIAYNQFGNPVIKNRTYSDSISSASLAPIASNNKPYFNSME